MKAKHLLLGLIAACALVFSCRQPDRDLGLPSVEINQQSATVDMPASSFTMMVLANRAWRATADVPWIAIDPDSGQGDAFGQKVTVTVTENTSFNRTGHVVFDIVYGTATLTVDQAGNGSPEDYIIYYNDFDKEVATQSYGSGGTSWPYLDQFDGWKNQIGVGVATATHDFSNVSARNNSNSNGSYSDYAGSGLNNLLFGANGHYAVKNLSLKDFKDFRLSFGTEKYDNNDKTALFDPAEMPVYLSADGAKWIPLSYSYLGTAAGRWNVAEAVFSVPADVTSLSVYVAATVASAYRMDDLKIEVSEQAGTVLDFSNGGDLPSGGGGDVTPPSGDAKSVTVAEFNAAPESNSQVYELVGTIGGSINTSYGNFDLTDDTGTVYVYGLTATNLGYGAKNDQSYSSLGLKEGDKIKIHGYRGSFNDKIEVMYAWFIGKVDGGGGGDTPAGDVPFAKLDPSNFKEGKYVIAYPSGSSFAIMKNAVQSNYYVAATAFDLKEGKAPTEEHVFTVAKSGSGYTIKNNEGGYVGVEVSGTHYNLKPGLSSPYVWTFTAQSDGSIEARGSDSGDYVMSYDAGHNDYTLFNKTPSLPTFYYVEGAPSGGGGDTPGGGGGGDTPGGSSVSFSTNADAQTWAAETDGTYGSGFATTGQGLKIAYYKHTSTSNPVAPNASHVRVYKNSALSIGSTDSRKIKKIVLGCAPDAGSTSYCFDMAGLEGGASATADKATLTVTWTGSASKVVLHANNGQVRMEKITVEFE